MSTLTQSSDPVFIFAFWLGVGVASLAVVMLVLILVLRQAVLHRERIHARAVAYWKKYLIPNPDPEPANIPPLLRRDLTGFLQVWNEVHEPMQGATTPYLARVARETKVEQFLYARLRRGTFHARLVAIIALGHIRNKASFVRMQPFIDDPNPIVSLCTVRSLMQIDPTRAVSQFVPRIVSRNDWSQGSVATILGEAGAGAVSHELSSAALQANAEMAPRLVRFLAGVSPEAAAPIIHRMLTTVTDERLLSTCLQVMTNVNDVDAVRPLLAHPRWHLRMQAAVTLGRLGQPGDEQRLIPMLADQQWWVRYRAAQALLKLSFFGPDKIRGIQATQKDGYARDIIRHVLVEQDMGLTPEASK